MLHSLEWERALESCGQVLAHDPNHVGALEVMAQAQWYAGRYESVVVTTTRLLHLNPYEPGYRYTRGMANLSLGKLQDAIDDFRSAAQQSSHAGFKAQVLASLEAARHWASDPGSTDLGLGPTPRSTTESSRAARPH